MKWLEVIQIRSSGNKTELLVEELNKLFADFRREPGGVEFTLFRHATIPSEFSLHLIHQSDSDSPGKSKTGLLLSATARDFGLIKHTIWILETNKKYIIGEECEN